MGSGTSMMVVGMMADASDGPDSSLSLGLAHDVFPLPLHYALCQLCFNSASATPPTFFDKSGPFEPCHEHSSDCDSDPKPGPGTGGFGCHWHQLFQLLHLCAALSGPHNEGIEMRGMFIAAFMQVLHLLLFTRKDDAYPVLFITSVSKLVKPMKSG